MATPTLSVSLNLTTTYQKLSTLIAAAYPTITNDAIIENIGYFSNLDGVISCYVAAGYTSAPSSNVGLLSPLQSVDFVEGMNANDVWLKSASGTPTVDFWIGASSGPAPSVNGVIGTITATTNTIPKASSGNLVDSSITDDGTTTAFGELVTFAAKVAPATNDGAALGDTTHNFSDLFLATGAVLNYANGNVTVTHSSGILTMGTGELRITTVGTNASSVPTLGSTSTFTNKTLTSPTINTPTLTAPVISTFLSKTTTTPLTSSTTISVNAALGDVFTLTPAHTANVNFTGLQIGQDITLILTTSGASSFTLTFNTNAISTGTLATGTVTAKTFVIRFISNGTNAIEVSRTVAM